MYIQLFDDSEFNFGIEPPAHDSSDHEPDEEEQQDALTEELLGALRTVGL